MNIFIDFQYIPNGTEMERYVLLLFEVYWERNWTDGNFQQRQNFKVKRIERINFTAKTIFRSLFQRLLKYYVLLFLCCGCTFHCKIFIFWHGFSERKGLLPTKIMKASIHPTLKYDKKSLVTNQLWKQIFNIHPTLNFPAWAMVYYFKDTLYCLYVAF